MKKTLIFSVFLLCIFLQAEAQSPHPYIQLAASGMAHAVAISPNGRIIACGTGAAEGNAVIRLCDTMSGLEFARLAPPEGGLPSVRGRWHSIQTQKN